MTDAQDRGWGPGWPNCQRSKWVTPDAPITGKVHERIRELVELLCAETERRGYNIVQDWSWGADCRPVTGTTNVPSNHSWALAVDINAPKNPYRKDGRLISDIPLSIIVLWESYDFRWGGRYTGAKDPMHFEFMGTPKQADRLTQIAREEFAEKGDENVIADTYFEALRKSGISPGTWAANERFVRGLRLANQTTPTYTPDAADKADEYFMAGWKFGGK